MKIILVPCASDPSKVSVLYFPTGGARSTRRDIPHAEVEALLADLRDISDNITIEDRR